MAPPVPDMPGPHRNDEEKGGPVLVVEYDGVAEEVQETLNGVLQKIQVYENVMMAIKAIAERTVAFPIPENKRVHEGSQSVGIRIHPIINHF